MDYMDNDGVIAKLSKEEQIEYWKRQAHYNGLMVARDEWVRLRSYRAIDKENKKRYQTEQYQQTHSKQYLDTQARLADDFEVMSKLYQKGRSK